jgi:hypothetical protein
VQRVAQRARDLSADTQRKLKANEVTISKAPERGDLKPLLEDKAIVNMLKSVEKTAVGKKAKAENDKADSRVVKGLDRRDGGP